MPQESVVDENMSTAGEPKKRGRFLVVEQQGQQALSKVNSQASLQQGLADWTTKGRGEVGKDGVSLGKPPTAPVAGGSTAAVSVGGLLPRLQEILDHAMAHQQGIQRLVAAVQDAERGKASPLLNRSVSTRALFSDFGAPPPAARVTGDGSSDAAEMDSARLRIAELEAEVVRLRARNQLVESQLMALAGDTGRRATTTSGPGTETPGSAAGTGLGLSPSDGPSPRDMRSDEAH